jgi:4,5-dihydroxyphthalate decarboxylase
LRDYLVLRTALGQHDHLKPLKSGAITSDRIRFEFVEFNPLPEAFRAMIRGEDLDASEMALTTHLLALEFGKPLSALPIPLWRRLHHGNLVCRSDSNIRGPKDLEGQKVGVRAYSQTTGVWIRGILKTRYGVDLDSIIWVTKEDSHVAEYRDPACVERSSKPQTLRELLLAGEVAAIMGERNVDPANVRPVIADSDAAAEQWSESTGIFPVNHVFSVRFALLQRHPWLAAELMRMFDEARRASGEKGVAALPYGLGPNRDSMQMLCDFAADQKLTSKVFRVDDVFAAL